MKKCIDTIGGFKPHREILFCRFCDCYCEVVIPGDLLLACGHDLSEPPTKDELRTSVERMVTICSQFADMRPTLLAMAESLGVAE